MQPICGKYRHVAQFADHLRVDLHIMKAQIAAVLAV